MSTDTTVQYELYPLTSANDLGDFLARCLTVVEPYTRSYIWQQDQFHLIPSTQRHAPSTRASASAATPPFVWGSSCVGENVEDEWFIVSLLLELTKQVDCVARVWDNDGDFLLIEAAYSLPKWVTPDTAVNRVWLYKGGLHIIPRLSAKHPTLPAQPTVKEALSILSSGVIGTTVSSSVHAALQRRLLGLPQAAASRLTHRAHALVPVQLASLLDAEPQLISLAVQAFHYRDVDDMLAFTKHRFFSLPASVGDLVVTSVRFNRCQFAQMVMQNFQAPKHYPMPPLGSPQSGPALLGLKLLAGMEMALARHVPPSYQVQQEQNNSSTNEQQPATAAGTAFASSAAWQAFLQSLQRNGYFREELPGSQLHRQLLKQAQDAFLAQQEDLQGGEGAPQGGPQGALVARCSRLLQEAAHADVQGWQSRHPVLEAEDDPSWLHQGASELDAELALRQEERDSEQSKQGNTSASAPGGMPTDAAGLADTVERLQGFLEATAGPLGAQVPEAYEKEVSAKMDGILSELSAALGVHMDQLMGGLQGGPTGGPSGALDSDDESGSEGSSFFSDPSTESDAEDDVGALPKRGAVVSENAAGSSATDAAQEDVEESAEFFGEYMAVLQEQLQGSTLGSTFKQQGAGPEHSAGERTNAATGAGAGSAEDANLQPLDVDLNLLQNLLASVDMQGGVAGPASNLAGMLGVQLAPDRKRR